MRARDVMTTKVISVTPDMSIREAARIMLANRISAVPVVDVEGRARGMLSEGDLMRRAEAGTAGSGSWWLSLLAEDRAAAFVRAHGLRVGDVMTPDVISIAEQATLPEVAALLERHHIKRVPVLKDGKVVGIVSRANLLHGIVARQPADAETASDSAIRTAITEALAKAGVASHYLNVVVSEGIVYLWGATLSGAQKDAARVAAETAPGVKRVENNLFVLDARLKGALGSD